MTSASNFVRNLFFDDPDTWYPVLSVYYLTYACELRCPHCSDGSGTPYWRLEGPTIPGTKASAILKQIRRHCDHVVITGGEPLEHPDVDQVLAGLPALRFKTTVFTTNGLHLDTHLEAVARSIDDLVVSLNTLDAQKADRWYGQGPGTLERILSNLQVAAQRRKRRYTITISAVVTPDNIDDLREVYLLARERGFQFAACPQLKGVKAHPDLVDNPAYQAFYDFLIEEKVRGYPIFGMRRYLETLRDIRRFKCRPFTMLVVAPDGGIYYPCLEKGGLAGNILDTRSLHRLRVQGRARSGPQPVCGNQCQSACALSFAVALDHPVEAFEEAYRAARAWLEGFSPFHIRRIPAKADPGQAGPAERSGRRPVVHTRDS